MVTTPLAKPKPRGMRCSSAAVMGLVAVVAVVSRWPWTVLPAAVMLAIYIDGLRLPLLQAVLVCLVLAAALAIALAPRVVQQRREMARPTGSRIVPNKTPQRSRPVAAVLR
jgi:O-antigen ligase